MFCLMCLFALRSENSNLCEGTGNIPKAMLLGAPFQADDLPGHPWVLRGLRGVQQPALRGDCRHAHLPVLFGRFVLALSRRNRM